MLPRCLVNVLFCPESGLKSDIATCPLSAKSGLMDRNKIESRTRKSPGTKPGPRRELSERNFGWLSLSRKERGRQAPTNGSLNEKREQLIRHLEDALALSAVTSIYADRVSLMSAWPIFPTKFAKSDIPKFWLTLNCFVREPTKCHHPRRHDYEFGYTI